jgi:MOSC domain-containing protein YiiM
MSHVVHLLSVNMGVLEPLAPGSAKRTGIHKHPVGGPVLCDTMGLVGDRVGNTRHHGGADQAVYLYSAEDYAWWRTELGRDCNAGLFGENLTIDRWWPNLRVGDRVTFGEVTLELTAPRIPCATLAGRMGDPQFVKRFMKANRSGAYARVITAGAISSGTAGDAITSARLWPTISELFWLWYHPHTSPAAIASILEAPIAARTRQAFEGNTAG